MKDTDVVTVETTQHPGGLVEDTPPVFGLEMNTNSTLQERPQTVDQLNTGNKLQGFEKKLGARAAKLLKKQAAMFKKEYSNLEGAKKALAPKIVKHGSL